MYALPLEGKKYSCLRHNVPWDVWISCIDKCIGVLIEMNL
jgi:hypothetical protein